MSLSRPASASEPPSSIILALIQIRSTTDAAVGDASDTGSLSTNPQPENDYYATVGASTPKRGAIMFNRRHQHPSESL